MTPQQFSYPPAPTAPPPTRGVNWPVPPARIVPLAWSVTLVALTALSVLLALSSALMVTPPPATQGQVVYASSLAHADGAWQTPPGNGTCAYANGGLDATSTAVDHITPACILKQAIPGNLRLSVRLAPQAQLTDDLRAAILVHGAVAFLFDNNGTIEALQYDPVQDGYVRVYVSASIQWHAAGAQSNTVVIQANNGVYTLALNGAQIYQGAIATTGQRAGTGDVALGTYLPQNPGTSATSEALFTDVSISTF